MRFLLGLLIGVALGVLVGVLLEPRAAGERQPPPEGQGRGEVARGQPFQP